MKHRVSRIAPRVVVRSTEESGVALITALLALMLMSAMMIGMFAALNADTRAHLQDRDQTQAYAAAQAGLEKLTASMASLFATDWSPSPTQITGISATPPTISGFSFTAPGGTAGSGYAVGFTPDANGNPTSTTTDITAGPFTGFKGIITPYQITVTAISPNGSEGRLRREMQTIAVPVLQFGVFSENDLTFYAGDDFAFGGRVHTNKNLFMCEFGGTMTFSDRLTAVGDVIHHYFSNGLQASSYGCAGPVMIPTSSSTSRNLQQSPNEGSVTGMPGSAANGNWPTISTGAAYYKGWILNGLTGAKKLDLPLVSQGAVPVDLIRRPALNSNEHVSNAPVYGQRFFAQASLRILLSDRLADLTGLPSVTATAPTKLFDNWLPGQLPPAGYVVGVNAPPIALSEGPVAMNVSNPAVALPNIKVAAAIPATFKIPATLTVNTGPAQTVSCTGKTATSFTGCTSATLTAIPQNTVVTATGGGLPGGFTATTTVVNPSPAARANAATVFTINVGSTMAFAPNSFWIDGNLWTCTGYDTTPQFTGCANTQGAGAPAASRPITTSALSDRDQPRIGGYIKIEKQNAAGAWSDVTAEILALGIGDTNQQGSACGVTNATAIIRIQRLRDNGNAALACTYANSTNPYDWWPNTLYDAREGNFRTVATTADMHLGGVMQYISLDVANLKRWLAGAIGVTGGQTLNNNGYIVYFSDRRGDHNELHADVESGQFGFEDQVNPNTATGTPDALMQTGEDMNANGVQDIWGDDPSGVAGVIPTWAGAANGNDPYSANGRPWTPIAATNAGIVRVNKVVHFRRALKLINGGIVGGVNSLPDAGLTVASENPVYVQGNYNATTLANAEPNRPAAIIADAITLLSTGWTDANSLVNPNNATSRNAVTTGYRFGAVAGKGLSFPHCGGNCGAADFLFGTDGGAGNFLRLLEDWNGPGATVNYRGSLVSLFNSTQATGTFKYNVNVYDFASRNFSFDTDFLTPALLPPGTPMFRDINTLKFRQILRPNQ